MYKKLILGLYLAVLLPASAGAQTKIDPSRYAPVPSATHGPAIPDKGYLVEEIRGGVYWVTEGIYQAVFTTTGEGVIVVDAPPNIGDKLLTAIAEVTDEPVKYFIYSHQHKDHVGRADMFPPDTVYIGHDEVAKRLTQAQDPHRPVPTITFADDYVLSVGTQTIALSNKGV